MYGSSQVRQRLGNSRSLEERVRLVDELLLRQSLRSPGFDGISAAAHRIIQAGGRVGLSALTSSAGLGVRQFERRFIQQVGVRPKLFARIARFEAALDSKARYAAKSWTTWHTSLDITTMCTWFTTSGSLRADLRRRR